MTNVKDCKKNSVILNICLVVALKPATRGFVLLMISPFYIEILFSLSHTQDSSSFDSYSVNSISVTFHNIEILMNSPRRNTTFFHSGSMTDYLVSAVGLGLLIVYLQQPLLSIGWGRELRLLYQLFTIGMIVWGLRKPLGSLFPFLKKKKRRKSSDRTISWSGILLVFVGMELIYWSFYEILDSINPVLMSLLGAYLIFWGAKEILLQQIPSLRSSRARQRVVLPRPGVVYLLMMFVMLGGALLGRSNMLMLVFSLMAGPFIFNGWVTFTMLKRLHVTRELPSQVIAGERLMVDIAVTNDKWWFSSWLMIVTDRIQNENENLLARLLFVRIPANSERLGQYEICLMQRGRYQFGPLRIASRFPLGLTERGLDFLEEADLLVLPRLGKLTNIWHRTSQQATELVEQEQQRRSAFDDEFHSIREYRKGDNPRAIHWRTSARQNELMVREYRQSRDRHTVLLLDLWEPKNKTEQDIQNVELAISFAATICIEQMKRGGRNAKVRVSSAGETVSHWHGEATPGNMEPLLCNLAEVQSNTAPNISELVEVAAKSRSANTQIVLITTHPLKKEENNEPDIVALMQESVGNDLLIVPANTETLEQFFILEPVVTTS